MAFETWEQRPFVAVIGLHSSGSSCCARVLDALGIHMGNVLVGFHGGEAQGLAQFLEKALPMAASVWLAFSLRASPPPGRCAFSSTTTVTARTIT